MQDVAEAIAGKYAYSKKASDAAHKRHITLSGTGSKRVQRQTALHKEMQFRGFRDINDQSRQRTTRPLDYKRYRSLLAPKMKVH